jgi:hypothetical protein
MTTTVITSSNSIKDSTENVGSGNALLVTSSGSIVNNLGDGVDATQAHLIAIDGFVYGTGDGVVVNGGNTSVTVGSQGSIRSFGSTGSAVAFLGKGSATFYTLTNSGVISGLVGGSGVVVFDGGSDLITNTGQISGTTAIDFLSNVAPETVENSGVIAGEVTFYQGSGGDLINNTGQISGALSFQGNVAGETVENLGTITGDLSFSDASGTASNIVNAGTILGTIGSVSDFLGISNSGTIHGSVSSGNEAFALARGSITNSYTGEIMGEINFSGNDDELDNAGTIDGAISLQAGSDVLKNTGDIDGNVSFSGFSATNPTNDKLINSGTIAGDVSMAGADDTLLNRSQIYGDVRLTNDDTLTNTGTIHGNVKLGARDIVDNKRGEITGVMDAGNHANDTFQYLSGEQTINHFLVGNGSSPHDTISFAGNDFGSAAAVLAAMSQQGADTVIRLDATDEITLLGVSKTSFTSAVAAGDFKFV